MDLILKNLTQKDIILDPVPHLDIKNAFPEEIVNGMLNELPDKSFLEDVYKINSKNNPSAIELSINDLRSYNLDTPYLSKFIKAHSSPSFKKSLFNLFGDHLKFFLPLFKPELVEPVETSLFINPIKTNVSDINKDDSIFIRGPHLDDAVDVIVFLYYLKPEETVIKGGSLDLYKYKSRFKGFRRDIWWDERELHFKHIEKVKSIPYENNRFIILLDNINAIHGVTPIFSGSKGYRYRLSGGLSTPSNYRHYNYRDSLNPLEVVADSVGLKYQKLRRKIHKHLKF